MASLIYDHAINNVVIDDVNLNTDTFKVLLATYSYTPSKANDVYRSAVTAEVTGTGYTAGGQTTTTTITLDTTNNAVNVTFSGVSWSNATITASCAVIYKSRGGAASADELVAYVDFGQSVSSTNAAFAVTFSSPLKFQL